MLLGNFSSYLREGFNSSSLKKRSTHSAAPVEMQILHSEKELSVKYFCSDCYFGELDHASAY